MGGPTLMLGEGYSPDGVPEGPAGVSLGEDEGRKAVLPGDSEQEDSEPESSWRRRRIKSSSTPAKLRNTILDF